MSKFFLKRISIVVGEYELLSVCHEEDAEGTFTIHIHLISRALHEP